MSERQLKAEWFPAYGIRFRELPHIAILGITEEKARQNLNRFKANALLNDYTYYDIEFVNEPFEVE